MFVKQTPPKVNIKGYKKDDCTVNAIGNGLGISYDLARKIMQTVESKQNGELSFRKRNPLPKSNFHMEENVRRVCESISSETICLCKNRTEPLMVLAQFAKKYNKGRYIVLVNFHLTTVIDGKIVDNWNPDVRKVRWAYRIDKEESRDLISELAKFYKMNNDKHMTDHLQNII